MIYNAEELRCMGRLLLRRSVDFAAAAIRLDPDDIHQKMWVDVLARQIDGLQALVAIGENRVEDIETLLETIKNNLVAPPPRMAEEYMSGLSESDRADEAAFIYFIQHLGVHLPVLEAAANLARQGPTGDLLLKDSDTQLCTTMRQILAGVSERADGQDPEILGDSLSYIIATDSLCSAVVSLHAGHPISSERLSGILDALDTVSPDDFDGMFLDTVGQAGRRTIEAFRQSLVRYIVSLTARIILNARYPQLTTLIDLPSHP